MVRLGRCTGCLRGAVETDDGWQHDPGEPCDILGSRFLPIPPFDPYADGWIINDPETLIRDLVTDLPADLRESAARSLLTRYPGLTAAGVADVRGLYDLSRRLADGDDLPDALLSTDYTPGDDGESDPEARQEEKQWETDDEPVRPVLYQTASGAPRSSPAPTSSTRSQVTTAPTRPPE